MFNEMKVAINVLVQRIKSDSQMKADDALKLSQAALNLAHVYATLNANQ